MPERIIWSRQAESDLEEIVTFFNERNQSSKYSKKLISKFEKAGELLLHSPFIGFKTDLEDIRFLIIQNYLMFYEVENERIIIHSIWDSRQDPDQMVNLINALG
jgi:addiction module RelE/StbE family toxin